MTRTWWQDGTCWLVVIGLLAGGCAAGGNAKSTRVSSLASSLSLVDSGGPTAVRPPDPEKGGRLFRQAMQQFQQGNQQQALALLEQSADADPTQPATFNNLGILYKRSGMLEQAVEAYQQAIVQQENYAEAHYNLGLAYRASGQFTEAKQAYLNAISFNDRFPDAHYNLGILYDLYLGKPADALKHYQAYLSLGGPHAKQVKRWVSVVKRLVPKQPQPAPPAGTESSPDGGSPAAAPPDAEASLQGVAAQIATSGATIP